jgi:hypothetical protein
MPANVVSLVFVGSTESPVHPFSFLACFSNIPCRRSESNGVFVVGVSLLYFVAWHLFFLQRQAVVGGVIPEDGEIGGVLERPGARTKQDVVQQGFHHQKGRLGHGGVAVVVMGVVRENSCSFVL